MGGAPAQVRLDSDGLILHGWYMGTSDVCLDALSPSWEGAHAHAYAMIWPPQQCTCGRDEPCWWADLYTRSHWPGRACRHCMLFLGPSAPLDEDRDVISATEVYGLPTWWEGHRDE